MAKSTLIMFILLVFVDFIFAKPLDFTLYKMDSKEKTISPVLLILSGIQGDEPGAFNATSIFIKHYKIINGNIWVVPNLNQHSILRNNRGIYGDMNRKFAYLSKDDPEFDIIENIKKLILNKDVGIILHLHDGSGFYREKYINNLLNPNRWGNCSIIDQNTLVSHNDLNERVSYMVDYINNSLLNPLHKYRVRNTNTALGDKEQEKSLTYFATINKKMAFANEASKNLPLSKRVYYHLLAIEGMLSSLDIKFEKDFVLDVNTISSLINSKDMDITINNIIKLPLFNLKAYINHFPTQKSKLDFVSNTPVVWLFYYKNMLKIKNGNNHLAFLKPFYIDFDYGLNSVDMIIDNQKHNIKIGEIIKVKDSFKILSGPYRVNVIGFYDKNIKNEVDIDIKKSNLINKFSLTKDNMKFRVEFYTNDDNKNEKFAGMIVVDFTR